MGITLSVWESIHQQFDLTLTADGADDCAIQQCAGKVGGVADGD
jgi:hypothetical protein